MADTPNNSNKRSAVWEKFRVDKNNPKMAICECGQSISRGGNDPSKWGTTGLIKHLQNAKIHKEERALKNLVENKKASTGKGLNFFQTLAQTTSNAINYFDADQIPNANATNLVVADSQFNDIVTVNKVSSNWVNKVLEQPTLQQILDKKKLWTIHSTNARETHKMIGHFIALIF